MKIGLYGYGKMGRAIEAAALERGHSIAWKLTSSDKERATPELLRAADVIIEFTRPESAPENIEKCLNAGIPVVTGTTGWYTEWPSVHQKVLESGGALLTGTNFSLGVNIFFALNEHLAKIMNRFPAYNASITEIHHTAKLDKPSGTAISLAEQLIANHEAYPDWQLDPGAGDDGLPVFALREEDVPGTHTVRYHSDIDDISITHIAHNRKGFALGAILAAEFLADKKGVYSVRDIFNL